VLDRLARLLGCSSDSELATALGVPRSTVGSWRSRESIPYAICVETAASRGVDLNDLFLGRSSAKVAEALGPYDVPDNFEASLARMRTAAQTVEQAVRHLGDRSLRVDLALLIEIVYRYRIDVDGTVLVLRFAQSRDSNGGDDDQA
jgi:hypothetical protein